MAQRAIYNELDPQLVRSNFQRIRAEVAAASEKAGHDPAAVEILAATKYVAAAAMPALAEAGIGLVGENRAQDLKEKHELHGDRFTWDFIGHLQTNKVRQVLGLVRLIHSVDSISLVEEIDRRAETPTQVLLQINVGQQDGKYGIIPAQADRFLEEASRFRMVEFTGLMTMPPLAADPEAVRPIFSELRSLASELSQKWLGRYRFGRLSMGTSNDYAVAVEEGSTIVRLGGRLFK